MVTIRPAVREDAAVIARWMITVPLWQRYGLTRTGVQALLEKAVEDRHIVLAADLPGSAACGFAWAIIGGAFGRSAYLRLIGVQPGHDGKGIGTLLLQGVEQRAAAASNALFLLVSDFNTEAQGFYQSKGYTQVGSIPGYVLPEVSERIYWKRLR